MTDDMTTAGLLAGLGLFLLWLLVMLGMGGPRNPR